MVDPAGLRRVWNPRRVELRDRLLVEWVAQASVGDEFPEPWCWASKPLMSMIYRLSELGIIVRPETGTPWADIAQEASAAARVWLQENPPAAGTAQASQ